MAGLFSSGEQDLLGNIMTQRQQANQALGSGYGKYGGIVQAAGGLIDTGTDAMFGGKVGAADPRMQQMGKVKELFSKAAMEVGNTTTPAFYERLSQELQAGGYPEQAQKAADKAMEIKKQGYELKGLEDKEKAKKAVADVLAKNPNATSQELYAAAAPFSSDPNAIIKVVASREEKEAARLAKIEELKAKAADRLEELRVRGEQQQQIAAMNGASREEVARIGAESRMQASEMMGQIRLDIAREANKTKREIEASKRNTGVLAPSLQKDESKDLENIDNFEAMSTVLDGAVSAVTPDEKGVVALRLDPISRAKYAASNYVGRSTPESRAYSDLQASVAQAVNIKTDAARGVQTDKDVLRFANALIEASARNDVKSTREALVKFQNAAKTAAEKAKVRVNSRRQSQNVGAYFTDVATPEGTSPSGKPSGSTSYSDPDKERRYQEWKKKQGS
jgi:hypothetical protein